MTRGGTIIVVSQLPPRLRKGGRRVRRPPKPRPKLRVPGDELMRALVGQRTYASLGRACGRHTKEIGLFCRGDERNPSLKIISRFARALAVDESKVIEALRALWKAREVGKEALTSFKAEVKSQRLPAPPVMLPAEGVELPSRRPPAIRPSLQRLIAPAPFYRDRERPNEDEPQTIGIAGRDLGLEGDEFVWD